MMVVRIILEKYAIRMHNKTIVFLYTIIKIRGLEHLEILGLEGQRGNISLLLTQMIRYIQIT